MFFDRVLDAEPENGEAWWGKLLIELELKSDDELDDQMSLATFSKIAQSQNYANAVKYASDDFKTHFDEVNDRMQAVAQERKRELEHTRKRLSRNLSDEEQKHNGKSMEIMKMKRNAQEQAQMALAHIPPEPAPSFYIGRRLRRIRKAGLAVSIVFTVLFFTFFILMSSFPLELYDKLGPIWEVLTWGLDINSWGYAIAKSLAYGCGLGILLMLILIIALIVKRSKYNKKNSAYRAARGEYLYYAQELQEQNERLEHEDSRFLEIEKDLKAQIKDLSKAIDVYEKFAA